MTPTLCCAGMMEPMAPGPVGVVPSFPESQPMRPTALPGAAATYRNPFGEPLSPIRYNKPAPKVVLSPGSAERLNFIFSDLDPFKRAPSPRSQMPLHIMQRDPSVGVPLSQVKKKKRRKYSQSGNHSNTTNERSHENECFSRRCPPGTPPSTSPSRSRSPWPQTAGPSRRPPGRSSARSTPPTSR
jgi:hypothetical protein